MSLKSLSKSLVSVRSSTGPALLGFQVWIDFAADAPAADLRKFDDRFDRFLDARGLEHGGTRLQIAVWSEDRHLTLRDQVDVLLWLVGQCGPQAVDVGPLLPSARARAPGRPPTLRATCSDLDLMPIVWLYGRGRLSPAQVAEMLGGFRLAVKLH